MGLIGWLIIGLIAGSIAKTITPQKEPDSWFFSLVVGCLGSILGGFMAGLLGLSSNNMIGSLIIATVGAVLVLYLYHRYYVKDKGENI